jgi:coenzyme F420-reducing hydrogenase gamma subunit
MPKPKVAIFDFACCEGCQLQVVNLEEDILNLLTIVDVVEWREAMSEKSETYDVAIIEGSITRPEDEEKLRKIRDKAKVLVALGACAVNGGVNRLKNRIPLMEARRTVYGKDAEMPHLNTALTKSVGEVVKVDYVVPGCPIDRTEFAHIVKSLAMGREPYVPSYAVCVECRIKENVCRWWKGEVCLGPLTRAGCQAACPSQGAACVGCRGLAEDANPEGLAAALGQYGKSRADMESKMDLFLKTFKEPTHA